MMSFICRLMISNIYITINESICFLWQPFRGNPDYDTVADLPFDTICLEKLTRNTEEIHIKSINKCRMETMYRSSCMADMLANSTQLSKVHFHL